MPSYTQRGASVQSTTNFTLQSCHYTLASSEYPNARATELAHSITATLFKAEPRIAQKLTAETSPSDLDSERCSHGRGNTLRPLGTAATVPRDSPGASPQPPCTVGAPLSPHAELTQGASPVPRLYARASLRQKTFSVFCDGKHVLERERKGFPVRMHPSKTTERRLEAILSRSGYETQLITGVTV